MYRERSKKQQITSIADVIEPYSGKRGLKGTNNSFGIKFLAFVSSLALLAESKQSLCHSVVSVRASVCPSVSLFLVYGIKSTFLVINSLNPIDFQKNRTISIGKVAILSWKFAFLVYATKSTVLVGSLWNLQFVYLINSFKPIDFKRNRTISMGKVAILIWKVTFLVYTIKSTFLVGSS